MGSAGIIFLIGVTLGIVVRKTSFGILGALNDLLRLKFSPRLAAVLVAIFIFGLINFWGYQGSGCADVGWGEFLGVHSLLGGFVQGLGYVLARGCPLSLIVKLGEGSKYHLIVLAAFIVGLSSYALLHQKIDLSLSPYVYTGARYLGELISGR